MHPFRARPAPGMWYLNVLNVTNQTHVSHVATYTPSSAETAYGTAQSRFFVASNIDLMQSLALWVQVVQRHRVVFQSMLRGHITSTVR